VKILTIHYLRGLAALAVVLKHFGGHLNVLEISWLNEVFSFGHFGVDVFFVISGFVIVNTLEKNTAHFFYKRFLRLYPVYWLSLIITTGFLISSDKVKLYDIEFYKMFFMNISMFQSFFGIENIDGLYWTLGVELKWYILMFIMFQTKHPVMFLIILNSVLFLYQIERLSIPFENIANDYFIGNYINLFTLGVLLYKSKNNVGSKNKHVLVKLSYVFVSILQAYFYIKHGDSFGLVILFLLGSILFFSRLFQNENIKQSKILFWLGNISYPLYLFHATAAQLVLNLGLSNHLINAIFIIVVMFLSADIIHRTIENNLYNRWKNKI
jgi:peptidoglycan/LPS O-acetylase OafA/YrhL